MKRYTVNAMIDLAALILFFPSLITGIVLYVFLPSGGGGGGHRTFLDISRDQWLTVHNHSSLIFAALVIIHLVLHWKYFRNINRPLVSEKNRCT
ncbi:MAG: hypothetical protein CVV33_01630 [Methanomicrobiales archaeon HGW-Methanomicrobiales-4]|nr:MAG: hypothetical protein CVV33_01630 [Methanomicrobiales archaeon HGW-Methanomicrobiales-4]